MRKNLTCKTKNTESGFEYDCEGNKGICKGSVKNGGTSLTILGSGGSINGSKKDLDCFDSGDLKGTLEKKYKRKVNIIHE